METSLSFNPTTLTYKDSESEHINSFGYPVTSKSILGNISYRWACEVTPGIHLWTHKYYPFPSALLCLYLLADMNGRQYGCAAMFHFSKGNPFNYTETITQKYSQHHLDNAVIDNLSIDLTSVEDRLSQEDINNTHSIIVRISVRDKGKGLGKLLLQLMMKESLAMGDQLLALQPTEYSTFMHPAFDYMIHSIKEGNSTLKEFYAKAGLTEYSQEYKAPLSMNRQALIDWSKSGRLPVRYWKVINSTARLIVHLTEEEIDELFEMWDNQ